MSFKQQVETADSTLRHYVTQGYMNGMKLCPIIGLEFDGNDETIVSNDVENSYNDGNDENFVAGNEVDFVAGMEDDFAPEITEDYPAENDENYTDGNGVNDNDIINNQSQDFDQVNQTEVNNSPNEYKNSKDDQKLINKENFNNDSVENTIVNEQLPMPSLTSKTVKPIKQENLLQIEDSIKKEKKLKQTSAVIVQQTENSQTFPKRNAAAQKVDDTTLPISKNSVLNEYGHLNPTKWMCFECKKEFSNLRKLNRHKKIHAEDKPFPCTTCYKSFSERTDLNRHLMRHFRTESDSNTLTWNFKCVDCHAGFNIEKDLKIHSSIHRQDGKISCYGCDKDFLSK